MAEWNSIKQLVQKANNNEVIPLDVMFRLLYMVYEDIEDHNKKFEIEDMRDYVKDETSVYNYSQRLIRHSSKHIETYLGDINEELKKVQRDCIKTTEEGKAYAEKLKELVTQLKTLQQERGHLLQAKEECESIKPRIDALNDETLNGMDVRLQELRNTFEKLSEKEISLKKEIESIEPEVEGIRKTTNEEETTLKELISEKNRLEKKLSEEYEDEKKYKDLLLKLNTNVAELEEYSSKYATVLTSFNSLINDHIKIDSIFAGSNIQNEEIESDMLKEAESVNDILNWMDRMQCEIEKLLSVYVAEFRALVNVVGGDSHEGM